MELRQKIRFTAVGILLVYSVIRFVFVGATLSGYGINPWIFLTIDIATTVTYVIGVEMLVVSLMAKRGYPLPKTIGWGSLAAMSFVLPYLYLFLGGKELPISLMFGLGFIVLLLLVSAILSILRQVRRRGAK